MTNGEEKITINLAKIFPAAARRVEILEDLQKNWADIVKQYAPHSKPYNLGINKIEVEADSELAANNIRNMKGNILRVLKFRYGYKSEGDFNLKVTKPDI